jgi:hypothetical protein
MGKNRKKKASALQEDVAGLRLVKRDGGSTEWVFGEKAESSKVASTVTPAALADPARTPSRPGTTRPTAAGMGFVEEPVAGQCVGTLRWDESSNFPLLPAWPRAMRGVADALPTGWRDYLEMRLPPDPSGTIHIEPPMLDGLSYPLTLLHAIRLLGLTPPSHDTLTLLIIGASSKGEARLLRDSNYWAELAHFLPGATLHLIFVGPEIDASGAAPQPAPSITAECVRGTLGALLKERPSLSAANTMVVGFNTGMGNGLYPLMQSWLPDLVQILKREMVAVFTCANDYADLKGEVMVWKLLDANMVVGPQKSPFKAVTIVRAPGDEKARAASAPPSPPAGHHSCLHRHRQRHHRITCATASRTSLPPPPGVCRLVVQLVFALRGARPRQGCAAARGGAGAVQGAQEAGEAAQRDADAQRGSLINMSLVILHSHVAHRSAV